MAGHAGEIRTSAFSGNGKRLALADEEGVVSVHETAAGRPLVRRNVARLLDALALDDQARRLAGADGQCHTPVWTTPTGKIQRQPAGPSVFGAQALHFAADDRELVLASGDGWLHRWRLGAAASSASRADRPWLPVMRALSNAVSVSALAGQGLVTGDASGAIALWDLSLESCVGEGPLRVKLDWPVRALGTDTASDTVPIHTRDEPRGQAPLNTLHLWPQSPRAGLAELRGHVPQAGMAQRADGAGIVTHGGGEPRIRAASTPAQRAAMAGHEAWVTAVNVAPGGERASSRGIEATARLWNPLACRRWQPARPRVIALARSCDGSAFAPRCAPLVRRTRGAACHVVGPRARQCGGRAERARSNHGSVIAIVVANLGATDSAFAHGPSSPRLPRAPRSVVKAAGRLPPPSEPCRCSLRPRRRPLAARPPPCGSNPDSGFGMAATGAPVGRVDMSGVPVQTFVANADGTRVAARLRSGRVALYSLPDGRRLHERAMAKGPGAPRRAGLAFSPYGNWLAARCGGVAEGWHWG